MRISTPSAGSTEPSSGPEDDMSDIVVYTQSWVFVGRMEQNPSGLSPRGGRVDDGDRVIICLSPPVRVGRPPMHLDLQRSDL